MALPTVASCPSRGFSQDLTPSRVRLTPTRPSFPRRLISWSGLTTKFWLSSQGWSCSRRAQSVSGVTRAYLNRFWMAEVVQMNL